MKVPRLALLALSVLVACSPEKTDEDTRQKRIDNVAVAFERYVHRYYESRLANERGQPGPSVGARLKAREDLREALRGVGLDMPEGNNLKGALEAARDVLVSHDYVFLPLSQAGEDRDDELGIAFAHVRRREAARSMELWGKKVAYKLVIYEPLVYDYPTWRARSLKVEGQVYSPGKFSAARETIYIDHPFCVSRAQAQPPETQALGLDGIVKEVELRQAAYLLFGRGAKDPTEHQRLYERVLWTTVRYGDPDIAWKDVNGLAAAPDGQIPAEFRAAAQAVRAKLPKTLDELPTKASRAASLQAIAEEAWKALG